MTSAIVKRKHNLKPGEKVPLSYDEGFKIMFGNPKHIEPLTYLLSNILQVSYKELEGKIELSPLSIPNDTIGEKKMKRDILVTIRDVDFGKVILEVNFKDSFYETVINRNLNYLSEIASKGLLESATYDEIVPTLLVNFNTFYVDSVHKKKFDYYYFRNDEGHILTEKQKILNINIVDCYNAWYNGTCKEQMNIFERDLYLLSAAIYTAKAQEFSKIIEELSASNNIKKVIEEVSIRMMEDDILKVRYTDFLEENKKINQSIINDERKKARKLGLEEGRRKGREEGREEGLHEMITNMINKNYDLDVICDVTNLSIDEITKITNEIKK